MAKNINFLKEKVALLKKRSRNLFFIRSLSLGLLTFYGLVVFGGFSYNFLLKRQNEIFKENIARREKIIENLRSIETKQVYITSKIESLSQILTSKNQNQKIVESLFFILPEGISVSNFHINEDGIVNFSGTCSSLRALKNFFNILETKGKISEMTIKNAQIGGINYGFEKEYNFSVSILFYLEEG